MLGIVLKKNKSNRVILMGIDEDQFVEIQNIHKHLIRGRLTGISPYVPSVDLDFNSIVVYGKTNELTSELVLPFVSKNIVDEEKYKKRSFFVSKIKTPPIIPVKEEFYHYFCYQGICEHQSPISAFLCALQCINNPPLAIIYYDNY